MDDIDVEFKKVFRDRIFDHIQSTLMQKVPRWTSLAAIGDEPGFEGSVILDRSTGSLCYHNGLTWVCLDSLITMDLFNACSSGVSLVINGSGPDFSIAGLLAGTGIALASGPCVTISTVSNLTNACSTGVNLVIDGSGPDFSIAGLLAGTGITLGTGSCITINSFVNLVDNCPNLGNISKSIVLDGSGPDLLVRGLTSGTGIMLLNDSSCIIVCATGATTAIMLDAPCDTGISLIIDGSGPIFELKNLVAGTSIDLSDDGSCITISSTISLLNACPLGISLVVDGSGPNLSLAGLIAGTAVDITTDGSCVTIASNVMLLDACPTTSPPSGVSLVVNGSGPDLIIAGLQSGTGIDVTSDGSCVMISADASSLNTNITLTNACLSGISLVVDGSGPDLAISGLIAGTAVSISSDGTCVTINSTGDNVSLTNACPSGISLVVDGSGPTLAIAGLIAGTGITFSSTGGCITISSATSISSLFADGSATMPSIAFAADIDTGIYRPGSNTIGITTGGTSVISISPTTTTFGNSLILPTIGVGVPAPFDYYEEFDTVFTFSGPWAPITFPVTVNFTRIGRVVTLIVFDLIPFAQSVSAFAVNAATPTPTRFIPVTGINVPILVDDGGAGGGILGHALISGPSIAIGSRTGGATHNVLLGTPFSGAGTAGWSAFSVTYNV